VSCINDKTISATLDRAEALMQGRPDSALYVLRSLHGQQIPRGALQARYALLYTQARDKNYLPISGDSLINIAVRYYSQKKDKQKLGWAYLYLGTAYTQMDSVVRALNTYKMAQALADKYADHALLSVAAGEMGGLYQAQRHYEEALDLYKISLAACRNSGNQRNEGYVLARIGDAFYLSAALDSAEYYYGKAREIAIDRNDFEFLYLLSVSQAAILQAQKEYEQAQQLLLATIQEYKQGITPVECYPLLSMLYLDIQQIDSARHYMQLLLQAPQATAKQRAGAWEILQKIEEQAGNHQIAQHYGRQHKMLSDSIRRVHYVHDLRIIGAKYEQERLKQESFKQRTRFVMKIIGLGVLSLAGIFATRHWWKRGIACRECRFSEVAAKQDNEIEGIRRLFFTNHWNVDLFLKEFDAGRHYPTKKDFQAEAIQVANIVYPGFVHWLNKRYPRLKTTDIAFAVLLFSSLRPKELIGLYQVSNLSSLYTRCSRLYRKLGLEADSNNLRSFRKTLINLRAKDPM